MKRRGEKPLDMDVEREETSQALEEIKTLEAKLAALKQKASGKGGYKQGPAPEKQA